jgi:hypothetical protein
MFYRHPKAKNGIRSACKSCHAAASRRLCDKDPQAYRARRRAECQRRREKNPERAREQSRASKRRQREKDPKGFRSKKRAANQRWYRKHRETIIKKNEECARERRETDPKSFRRSAAARTSRYRKKHRQKLLSRAREDVRNLSDHYVITALRTSLRKSDIPQELVELKRAQIKLHRELKQLRK